MLKLSKSSTVEIFSDLLGNCTSNLPEDTVKVQGSLEKGETEEITGFITFRQSSMMTSS